MKRKECKTSLRRFVEEKILIYEIVLRDVSNITNVRNATWVVSDRGLPQGCRSGTGS